MQASRHADSIWRGPTAPCDVVTAGEALAWGIQQVNACMPVLAAASFCEASKALMPRCSWGKPVLPGNRVRGGQATSSCFASL